MVKIYTEEEFSKMREAGALASKQIKSIDHLMVPHTKLIDIDDFILLKIPPFWYKANGVSSSAILP